MTGEQVLEISRGFQAACVLGAAAELDVFAALGDRARSAEELAGVLGGDLRGMRILLDALVAIGLLHEEGGRYALPEGIGELLARDGEGSVLAMVRHQMNCLRRWAQLPSVVRTGRAAERVPSIRGEEGDLESFIGAMDNVSAPVADGLVRELRDLRFRHVLDVGGASGTWTIAFLEAFPGTTATLFDLPSVMAMAERRLSEAGARDRVKLAPGDFQTDPLPGGADLVWVSAIVHQNSRAENRALFEKVREALVPGGALAIRDIVMEPSRTSPSAGALFAVNMLVGTESGGTFTLQELREDLEAAGFREVSLLRRDPGMSSIIVAKRPPEGG